MTGSVIQSSAHTQSDHGACSQMDLDRREQPDTDQGMALDPQTQKVTALSNADGHFKPSALTVQETEIVSRSSRDSLVPKQARQAVSEIKSRVPEYAIADEDDSLYPGLVDDYVCEPSTSASAAGDTQSQLVGSAGTEMTPTLGPEVGPVLGPMAAPEQDFVGYPEADDYPDTDSAYSNSAPATIAQQPAFGHDYSQTDEDPAETNAMLQTQQPINCAADQSTSAVESCKGTIETKEPQSQLMDQSQPDITGYTGGYGDTDELGGAGSGLLSGYSSAVVDSDEEADPFALYQAEKAELVRQEALAAAMSGGGDSKKKRRKRKSQDEDGLDASDAKRRKEQKMNSDFQKVNALLEANQRKKDGADKPKLTRKERRRLARVS